MSKPITWPSMPSPRQQAKDAREERERQEERDYYRERNRIRKRYSEPDGGPLTDHLAWERE